MKRKWPKMSIRWQCRALGLCRGSLYYEAVPMDEKTLDIMEEIDRQYMETPFYGRPKMTEHFRRLGHLINPKRIG